MKRIVPLITLLVTYLTLNGQTFTVTGTLMDTDNNPIVGASIIEKGTTNGVVTNIDGNYEINAPVGSTLVVSFVGYRTYELQVDESGKAVAKKKSNSSPAHYVSIQEVFPFLPDSTQNGIKHNPDSGSAIMSEALTYEYRNHNNRRIYNTNDSKSLKLSLKKYDGNSGKLVFTTDMPKYHYLPNIYFTSSVLVESVDRTPELQNKYAQGRPINSELAWQGPENGEFFGWGPDLTTLEYDGTSYPFDKNGRLVPKGTGNNMKANEYNANDIYKSGLTVKNRLNIQHKINNTKYFVKFNNTNQKGIIPNSTFKRNTVGGGFTYEKDNLEIESDIIYSNVNGKLSGNSPLTYQLMKAIYLTPPSFDNSNGYGSSAHKHTDSYLLSDNSQRSFAYNLADNPYWLLNNSIDNLRSDNMNAIVKFKKDFMSDLSIYGAASYNYQSKANESGIKPQSNIFINGVYFDNSVTQSSGSFNLSFQYSVNLGYNSDISALARYSVNNQNTSEYRKDFNYFPNLNINETPTNIYDHSGWRTTHNYSFQIESNIEELINLSATAYQNWYSDYLDYKNMPGGSISGAFNFHSLDVIWNYLDFISFLKLFGSYGNSYKALPLVNDVSQYSTLTLSEEDLSNYYLNSEMHYDNNLKPQNTRTLNVGVDFMSSGNILQIKFDWYNKNTLNAIFPVADPAGFRAKNMGNLNTRGIDLSVQQGNWFYRGNIKTTVTFTKYNTIVTNLADGYNSIPIAGFSFVSSEAIEGQPLGVITGTKYLRDENGNKVIGENGFPLADNKKHIIGNPNPKWLLSIENNFRYNNFEFSWLWEYKHKGDVWNGTRNTLSYAGLSDETSDQRTITNYIFEGVQTDGTPNTIPVDFANPVNELGGNRWYQYGVVGVAEDAIEDGSLLRLKEIKLFYKIPTHSLDFIRKLELGIFAHNLLVFSKYKGGNPENSLMGQPGGYGLDYFNTPSTKSYGLILKLKL